MRRTTLEPRDVVSAAYSAANRGRYRKANGFFAPGLRKELAHAHSMTLAAGRRLRNALERCDGKRGEAAARGRRTLRALIRANKALAALHLGSDRFLRRIWTTSTHGRSIIEMKATRQVIRGS